MELRLTMDMDDAAFDANPTLEAARIMRQVANSLEAEAVEGYCVDANGEKVGYWKITLA